MPSSNGSKAAGNRYHRSSPLMQVAAVAAVHMAADAAEEAAAETEGAVAEVAERGVRDELRTNGRFP